MNLTNEQLDFLRALMCEVEDSVKDGLARAFYDLLDRVVTERTERKLKYKPYPNERILR